MDYIQKNKEAWEEAFENRSIDWCSDIESKLQEEYYPFIEEDFLKELLKYNFTNKSIGQFCCNNGRELLSLMKLGFSSGVGFDIAENQILFANEVAKKTNINCKFINTDIHKIDNSYANSFDVIIITIGALCWFKDLIPFFMKVSQCLKNNGSIFINEVHPVTNMLGAPGEIEYDDKNPNKLVNSYFSKVWEENNGVYYITKKLYNSKLFTSFSHSFSTIFNAISKAGLTINKIDEFDYDIAGGMFSKLDRKGIPLSYILKADKK